MSFQLNSTSKVYIQKDPQSSINQSKRVMKYKQTLDSTSSQQSAVSSQQSAVSSQQSAVSSQQSAVSSQQSAVSIAKYGPKTCTYITTTV